MTSLKRFVACASAVALATGTTLAGAGIAAAQDEAESTGSLSSSSLDLGETVADLETAAEALNGPVTVTPNAEGGPTVAYVNETDGDQRCVGFTAPYSTITENDLDTDYDEDDLGAAIALIQGLEGGGDVSLLAAGDEGEPIAYEDPNADPENPNNDVVALVLPFVFAQPGNSVLVTAGEAVEWTAPTPGTPAIGAALCVPQDEEGVLGAMETNIGIDPQVVADQINGKIPGGSVEPVSAGSISGGSVETGASVLGSLAGGGDEEEPVEPPVETPAE
ncbi:MAG: hypothetical protein L0H20_09075 [Corynebacterium sp.]|uniref:hypothetical protein n=1 Tax=Corynebacterium sp. TaxID=1720 RepID=UPI00264A3E8F|nr:hypothetical protein [Corynebacterium sp.]MDN5723134.1 hypothetical protein [Corynebacterium sp.]